MEIFGEKWIKINYTYIYIYNKINIIIIINKLFFFKEFLSICKKQNKNKQ